MKSKLIRIRSSVYATNSFYIFDGNGKVMIIDPACSFERSKEILEDSIPVAIYLTHGHFDHTYDCDLFKKEFGTKIFIHEKDKRYLSDQKYGAPGGFPVGYENKSIDADSTFKDSDTFSFGDDTFSIIHTPGHTEGSCCFYTDGVLFSGDTLFKGSIGRTDFPYGCNDKDMIQSIKKLVHDIPDNTVIYPGHGFSSTMKEEREKNPYISLFI